MIRVLLADDQQLIREALAALLGLEVDLQIVGQVGSGDEVLGAVALLKPDVVLLDVQMPGTLLADGIEAAAALRDAGAVSESGEPVRTLIVTTFWPSGLCAPCAGGWCEWFCGEGYGCSPVGGGDSSCACGVACGGSVVGGGFFGDGCFSFDGA